MSRMSRVALATLVTVSAVLAQELPYGGFAEIRDPGAGHPGEGGLEAGGIGLDPGGPGGGGVGAGNVELLTRPDFGAALVSRFDWLDQGFFAPAGDTRLIALDPAANLLILPSLSEATDSLLAGYGISGHLLEITDAPLDPSPPPPHVQPGARATPGDPAAGALRIDPWWQGALPAPLPGGGVLVPVPQNAAQAVGADPGGPPPGSPQLDLIDVPAPAPIPDDRVDGRLVQRWGIEGPSVRDLQELVNLAAADVASSRIARAIDPNARRNRGATPEERRTQACIGLILMQVLDGYEVSPDGAQFLRKNLEAALAILNAARREPRDGDAALQQAIDGSACAIVDSLWAALTR